jgi:uncharacterized cofD-like protein
MAERTTHRTKVPDRVVAIGGGTGLPGVLRGLRSLVERGETHSVVAIVTMSDDGGSSGRLRRSMGVPPPGDVRNCLVALAEEESLLAGLFQYRYGNGELGGHSVGNLILAALAEQTGCFLKAVEMSSRVLRTVGSILPATQEDVRLAARLEDGSVVVGETQIAEADRKVVQVSLLPEAPAPSPGVVESIEQADLVVLGPGSLFTSILPNIAVPAIAEALRRTRAEVVLVANLVTERGERTGACLTEHVDCINRHAGGPIVDGILVNDGSIEPEMLERYRAEGAEPLHANGIADTGLYVERRHLMDSGPKLRHDPVATADGLVAIWGALTTGSRAGEPA